MLIVCIICEACLQNTPDRCVCALGFYALRTHRHTHNGVAALHGVFISEQILSKSLNLSLSIMDHRLEKSFLSFDRVLEDEGRISGEGSNKDPFRCMASRDSIST